MCPFTVRSPQNALKLSGFSRRRGYPRCHPRPEPGTYSQVRLSTRALPGGSTPTPFNALPSGRGGVTAASPRRTRGRCRNVDRLPVGCATRLRLRDRLTPGRLASPGKPWPCGGGDSRPPYRYLCLHLLFMTLHRGSRRGFKADMNAPLPITPCVIPRLRRAAYTRLLSTPDSSTSELLRTL